MKKAIKAFYILTIAIVVFLGGLLIAKGLTAHRMETAAKKEAAPPVVQSLIDSREGNAL